MKQYLVIDEFTLPGETEHAYTQCRAVAAQTAQEALNRDGFEILFGEDTGDRWISAVRDKRLDVAAVGIFELVSDHNYLPDIVNSSRGKNNEQNC